MYNKLSNLVLGFHGCDISVRDAVVNGKELIKSINSYDWLGNGFYFWENNEERALQWAEYLASKPKSKISIPSVLGAVIEKIHSITQNPKYGLEPYDSVRGLFIEGDEVYPGSGFREKTHVQICIVNPNCIKGYFIPREADGHYRVP